MPRIKMLGVETTMKCISIEVTDSLTFLAEVDYNGKRPRMYSAITVPTPEGTFDDGYIKDPLILSKELGKAIGEAGMKARHVVFSLSSNRIASRDVIIPAVKPNKIMALLTANASEYFPVDVSNYRMGYNVLETSSGENGEELKVLVIAIPNDLIKTYYKLADALGLKLQALDYIGNAVVGLTAPLISEKPTMVVKIGDASSIITIFKNRKPVLHRNIAYGVYDAIDSLMDNKKLELVDAVRELRKENYFSAAGEGDFQGPDLSEDLEMLANGIARVADYHNSRNEEKLHEIIITGFAANFRGLAEYIAEVSGIDTKVLEFDAGIQLAQEDFAGNYASAIGAAVNPIDFTLTDTRGKKKKQTGAALKAARRTTVLYVLSALCLLITIALVALNLILSMKAEAENRELSEERAELLPVVDAFNNYQMTLGLYNEVTHIYDITKNRNEELRAFVEELEQVIPSNSYVTSFSSDGKNAVISLTCSSKEEAGNMIESLRKFKSIMSVSVTGISESRDELTGYEVVQFTASMAYRPVGENASEEEVEEVVENTENEETPEEEVDIIEEGETEEGDH